jgi:hypothetical protein
MEPEQKYVGPTPLLFFSVVKTVLSGYTHSSLAVVGGRSLSNTSWSFVVDDPVPPSRFSTFLASSPFSLCCSAAMASMSCVADAFPARRVLLSKSDWMLLHPPDAGPWRPRHQNRLIYVAAGY